MIQIPHSKTDVVAGLSADFIANKQPLRDYAGFDPNSQFAGLARQTFSLQISPDALAAIRASIKVLYDQLIAACWPKDEPLPFDMIRFDAFLEPSDNSLKMIELNTRDVGMHEIVEWLDDSTASQFSIKPAASLNKRFVVNQKILHTNKFGDAEPLLYMSKPMIPKWLYFNELVEQYSSVHHVTSAENYVATDTGIVCEDETFHAVVRKAAWPIGNELDTLNSAGAISIMQPLWMRTFGRKDYLLKFNSPDILRSELFDPQKASEYTIRKDSLVLKVVNGAGSRSVFLGPSCSHEEWKRHQQRASGNPNMWIMQHYIAPAKHEVIIHGKGLQTVPIQLGIFVLPKPANPLDFDIDIVVKAYGGNDESFTFDPSGLNPDIWFGNVILSAQ